LKRALMPALVLILCGGLSAQESFIKQSLVVNIEVPVRVFSGDRFIDHLTLQDFDIFENGIPQKLEAVYLINKRNIERSEEKSRFWPDTERNFFFFFEVAEYIPRIGDAMAYFVESILQPDDNLIIVTPLKTYRLKGQSLKLKTRDKIKTEIAGMIRVDAWKGNAEYRNLIQEMEEVSQYLASALAGTSEEPGMVQTVTQMGETTNPFAQETGLAERLAYYTDLIGRLEHLRQADQYKLLDFARFLKDKIGQKFVFVFYQQEFIPKIDLGLLQKYLYNYQDSMNIVMKLSELEGMSHRHASFDIDLVKHAYADAATAIHFLFIKRPERRSLYGVEHEERSEDIFSAFFEMARATGGMTISSANPSLAFRKAIDAAEHYYLLYYSPKETLGDGNFRNIEVKIKGSDYRVHHRTGYFSR
jgi:hypothetical protein